MTRKVSFVLIAALLLVTSLLAVQQATARDQPALPGATPASAGVAVYINEVMPKASPGEYEWVELSVINTQPFLYLPMLSNGGASGLGPTPQASALQPNIPAGLDLDGYQLIDKDGHTYTIPAALPPVPVRAYVLVIFGPGTNDYDFSDGKAVLYTGAGLAGSLDDAGDQVALYSGSTHTADTIVDFVAWNDVPSTDVANAVAAGLWQPSGFISFASGFGDTSAEDLLAPNESLGRYPGWDGFGPLAFAVYQPDELSPGAINPAPMPSYYTPEYGAIVETNTFSVSWNPTPGALRYAFQIDNDADFSSPLSEVFTDQTYYQPLTPLPEGTYYWRLKAFGPIGQSSPWLGPVQFGVVEFGTTVTAEKVLGITPVRQNKDSQLLCLDGDPEGDAATDLAENAWDAPAPCTAPPCADTTKFEHGRMYCVVASIKMMASFYGGDLSMDRIAYHIAQEWTGNTRPGTNDDDPNNDLAHNKGWNYHDEEDEGISWALGTTITATDGKPTFAQVKAWIDADRPIMFRRPGHLMVIDGYRENDDGQFLHVLDPDQPPNNWRWQDYDTQNIFGYWPGPVSAPGVRSDEPSVWTDSDGDGIMDFDEIYRFDTHPYNADTDGDWVGDKQDMREYVFDYFGNYSLRDPDYDGDGLRKEVDWDNDNDFSPDGCEDINFNGRFDPDPGEGDNFDANDHPLCYPYFDILYPLKLDPTNAGDPNEPSKILVQVSAAVPFGWELNLTAADFDVAIGGDTGGVLSAYPSADTYFLVVDPPTQDSEGYYDLEVSLTGSGTDQEDRAVYYLPKNPNAEVIVLDRSGSMMWDGKMEAAQNAASAFVDLLNDGDSIGVASFASTASEDFALEEITSGSTTREDAIDAIDLLNASGSTALGLGVQQGYGMLTADANPEHDWSLVLLSDGWQNVPPYWADIESGITEAVVHTVALGNGADTTLLASIAALKHGNYYYVDVQPPLSAAQQAPLGGPPLKVPATLPNRLADAYLAIGEDTHGYQRLADQSGDANIGESNTLYVSLPADLPLVVFSLNWNDPAGQLQIVSIQDPGGTPVTPLAVYRSDTHEQWRLNAPKAGVWALTFRVTGSANLLEYFLVVSGKNDTSLIAAVGGDPLARTVGVPVPIYGILSDHKPIAEAYVYALVSGPGVVSPGEAGVNGSQVLTLYDDGLHGDGRADDGWYANNLPGPVAPGGHTVKVVAVGKNNLGEDFIRYATTGFNVLPRLVYIWKTDLATAYDYQALLQANGWLVDLLSLAAVADADFRPYELIIIGPDTGYLLNWGTKDAVGRIINSQLPVLGLGEGGYAFFGKLDLDIGYANGAHGSGTSIAWNLSGDRIWQHPYLLTLPKGPLELYRTTSERVDIYLPGTSGLTVFGYVPVNQNYANLILENRVYMLWGFDAGPATMTEVGQRLFINTVFRTIP